MSLYLGEHVVLERPDKGSSLLRVALPLASSDEVEFLKQQFA